MAHARQQIRAAVATALTGLATTGTNVYTARAHPIPSTNLPAVEISTPNEEAEHDLTIPVTSFRTLLVSVRAIAREATDVQDSVDQICLEVEEALAAEETLGGLCRWIRIFSTDQMTDSETERPTGEAVMTFQALYRVADADLETIIT